MKQENMDLKNLTLYQSILFFLVVLGLELRVYTLRHPTTPFFCGGFFRDRVLQTICPGWL
jgi:hypothetical protein